ncbi:MAG: hypothetical protein IKG65_06145 [Exiguobacterium sp.]|uniref:hypothetical protein n=1 Tax=unclassified Exiguobacterium TaxID=2644629 RepID=UPI001BEC3AE7|nr:MULTISPECIES: hypothetical protein [unclassified Exiguobacterium]MBQ6459526.1 hypothetical protein [Exiguobacterium sp.]MBR3061978.1 hypothetical protein [Exiguobacterium sp.]
MKTQNEQLDDLYKDVNRLVELAADLDDIQQELKSLSRAHGKRSGYYSLTIAQKQVDKLVNGIQREINEMEGGTDELAQPTT